MSKKRETKLKSSDNEYQCQGCRKKFPNETLYKTHIQMKHPSMIQEIKKQQNISEISQIYDTNIPFLQNYFQDIQDQILAFLGGLGEKYLENKNNPHNIENQEKQDQSRQENRAFNDFIIVRYPYEQDYDVLKTIETVQLSSQIISSQLHEQLKLQIQNLLSKLLKEENIWAFIDPIEIHALRDEQFTLISVSSIIRNHKKKEVQLQYKQFSIFVLWLTKICKQEAWKQLYCILVYITSQYVNFLGQSTLSKSKTSWNKFQQFYSSKIAECFPKIILNQLCFFKLKDIISFSKFYFKWVKYSNIY